MEKVNVIGKVGLIILVMMGLFVAVIVGFAYWLFDGTYTDERGYQRTRRDNKLVHA